MDFDLISLHESNMRQVYDGVRRRALPVLFKALEPGTDDDRMKGALWTINSNLFGRYAIAGMLLNSGPEHALSLPLASTRTPTGSRNHQEAPPVPAQ